MSGREAINYAARARASLSLALTCFEHFYGLLRPGEDIAFQHTSILVRPRQSPRICGINGGAAGYCPRVRCAYCTTRFITIAGRTRHLAIWDNQRAFSTSTVTRRSNGRLLALRWAIRPPSPGPSVPVCAPASGHAVPPSQHLPCDTGRTCHRTAAPPP